ncbi:UNVERIFIED_CONTAM: hypothetical protein FKN15_040759 [Acipenser sinensis]
MFKNVFGSGFLVRTAHTVLTWAVTLVLFLHDTDLRKQEARGELLQPVLFVLLVLVSVLLYFAVSLMDPGFVFSDSDVKFTLGVSDEEQEMIPQTPKAMRQRRCGYCLLQSLNPFFLPPEQQPMRAKHCPTCKHCVLRSGFSYAPTWNLWLQQNGFLLAAFCLVAVFSVVVILLLGSHLYLVSCNTTTWEFMSRHRISYLKHCGADENPFDQGIVRNLWSFFCLCRTVAWEKVYFREGSDPV